MSSRNLTNIINERVSVVNYNKKQNVSEDKILQIIDAGRLAPSSVGLEYIRIIAVRNQELKNKLAKTGFLPSNSQKVIDCDTVLLFVSSKKENFLSKETLTKKLSQVFKGEELQHRVDGYFGFLNTIKDFDGFCESHAYLTSSFVGLEAENLGLGATWIGGFIPSEINNIIKEEKLAIDKFENTIFTMCIGEYDINQQPNKIKKRVAMKDFYKLVK
ncbi:nitroreductase family protein [Spiroplasma endosymbiont of Anurida maritima]|uniref:nitroreductase family protein n=1 Tax=Spiroplasma endosymbiont of Anurida maritima TaxID=2967972 RepID=UPI0036D30A6D